MIAKEVPIGGIVPVMVDDIPHHGVRVHNRCAAENIRKSIPDNVIVVMIHHKRSLRTAYVAVDVFAEVDFDETDINPYRQLN